MSKKEKIFREGERVFDPTYGGWGVVENIRLESIVVRFGNLDLAVSYGFENAEKKLSFKEYDYVNGGFSQERPMPTISMPYLNRTWKYISRDKMGVYAYIDKPKWNCNRNLFNAGNSDFISLCGIINVDNLTIEMDKSYKIIDNDQST